MVKFVDRILIPLVIMLAMACGEDRNIFHVDVVSYLDAGSDIKMVVMPGGTYRIGSTMYKPVFIDTISLDPFVIDTITNTERPVHFVNLPTYQISSTEVTQEQYQAVMNENPSRFRQESNLPVESVSWYSAALFCNELSKILGYEPCYDTSYACDFSADGFRLPTEAEWEYAARAGTRTEYFFGDDSLKLYLFGWYHANSESKTRKVADKEPNPAELYDVHGNVAEWCQDWYDNYSCSAQDDPRGPEIGVLKVTRGGSWAASARDCRSAKRYGYLPTRTFTTIGFRIVRRD